MTADTRKTLGIVVGLGLLLIGVIYAAVRRGSAQLSDEEARQQAVEIAQHIDSTDKQQQAKREKLIKWIKVISTKRKDGKLPKDARKKLWEKYKELSPQEQVMLLQFLMPQEFQDWLSDFDKKHETPEARKRAVKEMVSKMQERFDELSDKEMWERRKNIDTPQGKAYIQTMQRFYADKMSAKQRSDFEPVAREMLRQFDIILQARKPKED